MHSQASRPPRCVSAGSATRAAGFSRWFSGSAAALLLGLCLAGGDARAATAPDLNACGNPPPAPDADKGRRDYRTLSLTKEGQGDMKVFQKYHLEKAVANLRAGVPSAMMSDLHFVLSRVPNHHEALRLLVSYDRAGGRGRGFPPAACYIEWAAKFAPDDVVALSSAGYFYSRRGETERAIEWYEQALKIDPVAAEPNYNLGLAYFQTKNYEKSMAHARQAYASGYPLPGLRDKLKSVGAWRETPE